MRSTIQAGLALALILAAAPVAGAHDPEGEPYYVDVDVHPPSGPGPYDAEGDCARRAGVPTEHLVAYTLWHVRPQVDPEHPSLAGWLPDCYAAGFPSAVPCVGIPLVCHREGPVGGFEVLEGHVAYELSTGNYSVAASTPLLGFAGPQPAAAMVGASGNSGLGAQFDCRTCPPPLV